MIIREPRDTFFWLADDDDGSSYLRDEAGTILTFDQWQEVKARIDKFYASNNSHEIAAYNDYAKRRKGAMLP